MRHTHRHTRAHPPPHTAHILTHIFWNNLVPKNQNNEVHKVQVVRTLPGAWSGSNCIWGINVGTIFRHPTPGQLPPVNNPCCWPEVDNHLDWGDCLVGWEHTRFRFCIWNSSIYHLVRALLDSSRMGRGSHIHAARGTVGVARRTARFGACWGGRCLQRDVW